MGNIKKVAKKAPAANTSKCTKGKNCTCKNCKAKKKKKK
jgi:hypothetical protein